MPDAGQRLRRQKRRRVLLLFHGPSNDGLVATVHAIKDPNCDGGSSIIATGFAVIEHAHEVNLSFVFNRLIGKNNLGLPFLTAAM